jgi:hypothetical protein
MDMTTDPPLPSTAPLITWLVTLVILGCFSIIGAIFFAVLDNPLSLFIGI